MSRKEIGGGFDGGDFWGELYRLLGLPILGYSLDIGKEHVNLIDGRLEKLIYSGQLDAKELDRLAVVAMVGIATEGLKYDKVGGDLNKRCVKIWATLVEPLYYTDADVRLVRRIRRDTVEKGRDIGTVLDQIYVLVFKTYFNEYEIASVDSTAYNLCMLYALIREVPYVSLQPSSPFITKRPQLIIFKMR
ncbi:hypothetical protein L1049_012686 [Liquidambar formosana]|uniref:Phosphoribulokinase/uridine kinase domain-containing protein n=1 Tax=Liquidambar formosana TaxID=63359 RepID=A0AAP0WWE1_LIQFO